MSLNTQIVIPADLAIEDVCRLFGTMAGAGNVFARPMRRAEHWVVEFVDAEGQPGSADAFLRSYAAEDYRELTSGPSTLLSMPSRPSAQAIAHKIAAGLQGWFRPHEGAAWRHAEDTHCR